LQLGPHVPQVLNDLTHFVRWKLPGVSIANQGLSGFRLKPEHSSTASFDRHPSSELVYMDQLLKHRCPGRVRRQEDRILIEG
jgi:hypothetical protein